MLLQFEFLNFLHHAPTAAMKRDMMVQCPHPVPPRIVEIIDRLMSFSTISTTSLIAFLRTVDPLLRSDWHSPSRSSTSGIPWKRREHVPGCCSRVQEAATLGE